MSLFVLCYTHIVESEHVSEYDNFYDIIIGFLAAE